MESMTIKFEWDDKLGKGWFNKYNLELCIYSPEHTAKDLLSYKVIEVKDEETWKQILDVLHRTMVMVEEKIMSEEVK